MGVSIHYSRIMQRSIGIIEWNGVEYWVLHKVTEVSMSVLNSGNPATIPAIADLCPIVIGIGYRISDGTF